MLRFPSWCVLAALFPVAGCLERVETITVHADGAITIEHEIRGDAGDIQHGAARMPAAPRFSVAHAIEVDGNGEPVHVLRASARFVDAAAVPSSFATAADPLRAEALQFTTELQLEETADGVIYRFRRAYSPRRWAEYSYLRARAVSPEVEELLDDLDHFWRKTPEQRHALVGSMLDLDCRLRQFWAESVMNELTGRPMPGAAELRVRAAIRSHCNANADVGGFLAAMHEGDSALTLRCATLTRDLVRMTVDAITAELRLGAGQKPAIAARLRALEHAYNVDQDLQDEDFVVRLQLPGTVEVHNGETAAGGVVEWRFSGKDLRDRSQVLVAHSLVRKQ